MPISMVDYVWQNSINAEGMKQYHFSPYTVPWFENSKRSVLSISSLSSANSQESIFQVSRHDQIPITHRLILLINY